MQAQPSTHPPGRATPAAPRPQTPPAPPPGTPRPPGPGGCWARPGSAGGGARGRRLPAPRAPPARLRAAAAWECAGCGVSSRQAGGLGWLEWSTLCWLRHQLPCRSQPHATGAAAAPPQPLAARAPDSVASGCVAVAPLMPNEPRWLRSSCSRSAGHRSCVPGAGGMQAGRQAGSRVTETWPEGNVPSQHQGSCAAAAAAEAAAAKVHAPA